MASDVHKNTDTKVETVSANSVCRQLPQKTAEQGLAAAVAFAEEVQWSLAIRRTISGVGFGEALKLLMNDRDMSVEQMESESGLSVSTVKRLRAGQDASVEQIVAISVALHLPPPVSGDLLRIRTLCATCLRHFVEAKAFKIALVPSADKSMDVCTVCQTRRGHDYVVMHR